MQEINASRWRQWGWRAGQLATDVLGLLGLAGVAVAPAVAVMASARSTVLLGGSASLCLLLAAIGRSLLATHRLALLLANHGRDVIARIGADSCLTYVSPAVLPMLGYQPAGLTGAPLVSLCHPDETADLLTLLHATPRQEKPARQVFRLRHADGSWVPVEPTLVPAERGETVCVLRDVTRWQAALSAARRTERDYQLIAEHAGDMIVRVRPDRTRAYVSPSAARVLGYQPEELRNLDFTAATHPEDRERVGVAYDRMVAEGGQTVCRFRLRHKTRGFIWVESTWTTQPAELPEQARDVVAIVRDVSERVAAEEQIAFLARHDPLTGLDNRPLLAERAEQALAAVARGGMAAILCLDLDLFKAVNDTFGHAAGDALLCQVAERIRACVRPMDAVARLGGDEFAVLQVGIERIGDAGRLASRLLSVLAAPFLIEGQSVPVSASLGIAVAPTDGTDYTSLLRKADAALYRAKAEGRGRWRFFEPAMAVERGIRERMVLELRQALARGEFVLHYMPQVALGSGRLLGFEALLRWQHPVRGLLAPGTFIRFAEETGLIVPIGAWALNRACADAANWPDDISVAVNFSAVQLRDRTLVRGVTAALTAAGLSAARLEIEITETVLIEDDTAVLAELRALHGLGVRVALDDFGTGYASLGYLRRFPFDKIKLDRSFVRDIAEAADARAIALAVAGLGRSLGIATLAEGVETAAQRDLLHAEGFAEAQGYFFGGAVDLGTARALIAARGPALAVALAG